MSPGAKRPNDRKWGHFLIYAAGSRWFRRVLVGEPLLFPHMVRVDIKKTGPIDIELPVYATPDSAGLDLQAALASEVRIEPGERQLIPTGLSLRLPTGYEGQVRPRSGLALRFGLTVLNSPGTIDADYRGEVQVLLINLGKQAVEITPKMRIAQLVIAPVSQVHLTLVTELDDTQRGKGGYGSTGV